MSYTIWREDPDGSRTIVAFIDDLSQIGEVIDADREKIDWDARYYPEPDAETRG